jgi:hypothetical protein
MALTLLQPGMEPLGQFDLADGATPVGGEVATFGAAAGVSAADGWAGLATCALGTPAAATAGTDAGGALAGNSDALHGLVDDGATGYGTLFGSVIGGTVGQGTGFGASSTVGVVVVGPNTATGSGKVTLWDKPGLYGVDDNAWASATADGGALNDAVYSQAATSAAASLAIATAGILMAATDTSGALLLSTNGGRAVGVLLGSVNDTSLVSTTTAAIGAAATAETNAVYFYGSGGARI